MLKKIAAGLTGLAALTAVGTASAAILPVTVDETTSIDGGGIADNFDAGFGVEFSLLGTGNAAGFDGDPQNLDITILNNTLDVAGASGADILGGVLTSSAASGTAADDGTDVIELLFSVVSGSAADDFGSLALVTIIGEFGADPLNSAFFDGFASFTINPAAPIPLPGGLVFMLSGLGGLIAARRRSL